MRNTTVRKSAYTKLNQAGLAVFAGNIFERMSNHPDYQQFSAEVTTLGDLALRYKTALDLAVKGGAERTTSKNELKSTLLKSLNRLSTLLDMNSNGLDSWVINAGMEPVKAAYSNRNKGDLLRPENLRATSTGIPGELEIRFQLPEPSRVRNNAVEYSTDNGVTWHNGTYGSSGRVKLKGLPSRTDVQVRVRSLGTAQRTSPWTEPVTVFVL